ncbi:hypothetical protein ACH42_00300 [Endozoicomonas sp. (ex Bugula neritina AB1)]|nr:hypothetical protein ACH42_00300 [Endozoicomonas sp. (ex Bugula neritina AB1)]
MLALRSKLKGIFAISNLAIQQYEKAGMPRDMLYPFGYFVPSVPFEGSEEPIPVPEFDDDIHHLKVAFVGNFIERKGLSTLIAAVRCAIGQGSNIELNIYGSGDPSAFDIDSDRIFYAGRIPFGSTQKYLLGYDLLVLPSYYDGWGVVVNEALCSGVPVLCSDQVGARVLVESFNAGLVFTCGDDEALASLLVSLSSEPSRLQEMKSGCASASEAIQPEKAARYMLQVFSKSASCNSLSSPWYRFEL